MKPTKTDSQSLFSVPDIPDIGTLTFGFGKSRKIFHQLTE